MTPNDEIEIALREARALLALCIGAARTLAELQVGALADILAVVERIIGRAADLVRRTS